MGNERKYREEIKYKNEEINEYKKALIELQEENNKNIERLQDIESINDRKLRQLQDEFDIAQHQESKAFALEKQIKRYQLRLEAMNDLEEELKKYKNLYALKCDDVAQLNQRLNVIPNLKQQIEKYKKEMIQYK